MQQGIHPDYHAVEVLCSCGNTFVTRSTYKGDHMTVDVCSKCHPFDTGKQKILDTGGRVARFEKRYGTGWARFGAPARGTGVFVSVMASRQR